MTVRFGLPPQSRQDAPGAAIAPTPELRAAVYQRVSTGRQEPETQGPGCARLCEARGFRIVQTFTEWASAAPDARRPVLDELVDEARRGAFRVVVVWALDRFGRSLADNVRLILELDRIGVRVVSVQEPWLDGAGPTRGLLIAIFSWVAEQERARIGERTRAGLDRARREGKRLGRPRAVIPFPALNEARKLVASGKSLAAVARTFGVGASTLRRALRAKKGGVLDEPQPREITSAAE